MDKLRLKKKRYIRRKLSIKRKIRKDYYVPRLCISKSNKNYYAQIIDDEKGRTLVGVSTLSAEFGDLRGKGNIAAAKKLGEVVAAKAKENGLTKVVFDRNGYLYHGKVKAFADSARENGMEF